MSELSISATDGPVQRNPAVEALAKRTAERTANLAPIIAEVRASGVATLDGVARALSARGVPTPSGRGAWHPTTVARVEQRAGVAYIAGGRKGG